MTQSPAHEPADLRQRAWPPLDEEVSMLRDPLLSARSHTDTRSPDLRGRPSWSPGDPRGSPDGMPRASPRDMYIASALPARELRDAPAAPMRSKDNVLVAVLALLQELDAESLRCARQEMEA